MPGSKSGSSILACAAACLVATWTPAAAAEELGLEQAVALALGRAPSLAASEKRVEARRVATLAPWSRFVPRLKLDAGADHRQDPLAGPYYSYFQPEATVRSQALNGGLSLTGELPFGTKYSLGAGQRVAWYSSLAEALNPRLEPVLRAEVSQSLWRGLLPSVTLAPVAQAEARIGVEEAAVLEVADQLALEAALAWTEAARTTAIVSLRERSLKLAEELQVVTQKLITGGELSQLDLALAKQTVSQRRVELTQAQRDAGMARDALAAAVFAEPGAVLQVGGLEDAPIRDVGVDVLLPLALQHSPTLKRAAAQEAELEARAVAEGDDVWPDIQLGVRGEALGVSGQSTCIDGYLADGLTPCGVHPTYRGGYDKALTNLVTGRFFQVGVTLSGEIPVWLAPASSDARATHAELAALELDRRAEELRLQHLVHRLVQDAEREKATLQSSEASLRLTKEALDAQETKLRAGRSTTFDLVRAQELLILAELQAIEAKARRLRASVELESAVGALVPVDAPAKPAE